MIVYIRGVRGWVQRFDFSRSMNKFIVTPGATIWKNDDPNKSKILLTKVRGYLKGLLRNPIFSLFLTDIWIKHITGKWKCDLYVETGSAPCFSVVTPTVIYLEDPLGLFMWKPKKVSRVKKCFLRINCKISRFRGFVFYSQTSKTALVEVMGERFVARYSLGICRPPGLRAGGAIVRKKNPQGARYLGFIAGEPYGKGITELFAAMAGIDNKTILKIITPKIYHDELKLRAVSQGLKIELEEWSELGGVQEFFSNIDVLVHPTFLDSSAIVVREALSAGVPVIVSDVFACCEEINDGVNGYILQRSPEFQYYKKNGLPRFDLDPLQFFTKMSNSCRSHGVLDHAFVESLRSILGRSHEQIKVIEPIAYDYYHFANLLDKVILLNRKKGDV